MKIIKTPIGTSYANVDYNKESDTAKRESSDCVVRAVASCMNLPYDESHAWVKKVFKRRDGGPTHNTYRTFKENAGKRFNVQVEEMGEYIEERGERRSAYAKSMIFRYNRGGEVCFGSLTMARFLKDYSKGTYFVLVSGHAFSVVDGVIYGNYDDSTRMRVRVESAFKVTKN